MAEPKSILLRPILISAIAIISCAAVAQLSSLQEQDSNSDNAQPEQPTLALTRDGYIPDQECAACHLEIYRSYGKVGMSKSFYKPSTENIIEDYVNNKFYHQPSNRHYEMIHDAGRFAMRRYQLDETGRHINEIEQQIDWVIGSGSVSRGYLYQTESGELFEIPIVWYTQEQSWGIAPGYDNEDHDGITRSITFSCMFCHNAYPDVVRGSDRYGQPHTFPKVLPQGVGCQRCHGPGAEHARLAEDFDASDEEVLAAIVNPAKLSPELRDDVCYQCHLQPSSKLTSFATRFGRDIYSYRPGQPLDEYLVHFDFDDGKDVKDRFQINHHPYRLRQSRCYIQSDGQMSCLTCHDPHRKVPETDQVAFYREKCFSCHELDDCRLDQMTGHQLEVAADDCVACHMPQRRTQDVIHVVMTDHLIQRNPGAGLTRPLLETGSPLGATVKLYWEDDFQQQPEVTDRVHLAISALGDGDMSQLKVLEAAIKEAQPLSTTPLMELGSVLLKAHRFSEARDIFAEILIRAPNSAMAIANAGVAMAGLGDDEAAAALLRESIELSPSLADTHYRLATVLLRLGKIQEAQTHYRETLKLRPVHKDAWFYLGNLLAKQNRFAEAAEAFNSALSIEPNFPQGYKNLGLALSYLDDWAGAIRVWRFGANRYKDDSTIASNLAMAYLLAPDESVVDIKQGLKFAKQAKLQKSNSNKARLALSIGFLLSEQFENALSESLIAREKGADYASCLLINAMAKHQLNMADEAKLDYNTVKGLLQEDITLNRVRDSLLKRADVIFNE
ncbi:MAG: tetratricopeptide repeat protein [Planctomycetes bacterium]|nr:tetratricopeptide repeat protein [Planctomycetota bacterium]